MTTEADRENILKAYKKHLSLNATYNAVRDTYTKSQVKSVLSEYAPYQITRKTKDTNKFLRTTTSDPNQYQGDLLFMNESYKRFNSGFNVFLILINVATRMIYLYPLKNKQAKGVIEAFEKFLKDITAPPSVILSDQGSEFVALKKTLEKDEIELITTNKAKSHSLGTSIVERAIRTIKEKIERYLSVHQTKRYIDALPEIVNIYNSTVHSSLGKAPNKITPKDIANNNEELDTLNKQVYKQIDSIKPGQTVRILISKGKLDKGGDRWSKTLYKVDQVEGAKIYLEGRSHPSYLHQLQVVEKSLNIVNSDEEEEKQFEDEEKRKRVNRKLAKEGLDIRV